MTVVRIIPPQSGGKLQTGMQTRVLTESGEEIEGIQKLVITLEVNNFVTAEATVLAQCEETMALLLPDLDTVRARASQLGFDLIKKG